MGISLFNLLSILIQILRYVKSFFRKIIQDFICACVDQPHSLLAKVKVQHFGKIVCQEVWSARYL